MQAASDNRLRVLSLRSSILSSPHIPFQPGAGYARLHDHHGSTDVADVLRRSPGDGDRRPPGSPEQVALTFRRMPQHTGGKGSYGHRHAEQEEIYFVITGKLQFKLGDDLLECGARGRRPGRAGGRSGRCGTTSRRTRSWSSSRGATRARSPEFEPDFWPE